MGNDQKWGNPRKTSENGKTCKKSDTEPSKGSQCPTSPNKLL